MDCRKPSSGFIDNIHEDLVVADGLKVGIAVIIIFFIMMIITVTIITTITIMTRWCSRAHRTSNKTKTKTLITIIIINIIIIIIITRPKPPYGRQGLAGLWARIQSGGTFWCVLNVSLHASNAQLGLNIVDRSKA